MNRSQVLFLVVAFLVFAGIYWGMDTTSRDQERLEMSRARNFKTLDIRVIENQAKENLNPDVISLLSSYKYELEETDSLGRKVELLKRISGLWYGQGHPAIAGDYAAQVAEILQSDESWSITGTTYAAGIEYYEEERLQKYCLEESRSALEKAISLAPDNVDHRVNLAVTYVENPPEDNPMKGIQMLLDLDKSNPDAISVQLQLARFGMQTGQYKKAGERLEKVLEVDSQNRRAACMLMEVYRQTGETAKFAAVQKICERQ